MSRPLRTLESLDLAGRRVLLRADLNVPLRDGAIRDDTRIRAAEETLAYLRAQGARVVLASHLGRPKGTPAPELSLRPVAERLGVPLAPDCIGTPTEQQVGALGDGEVLLLENLRFHAGEEANDPEFARALARLCDVYVNDAFGTCHRAHASTAGIVPLVKESAAGRLLLREIEALSRIAENPARPFVCVLGGAKVSDKLGVLRALIKRADALVIGGAMAYTFLRAQGKPTGESRVEADKVEEAAALLESPAEILLPIDHVVADALDRPETARVVEHIPDGSFALDIGPRSIARFGERLARAATVFWNGPLGLFETPPFDRGTTEIARRIADAPGFSVVGGGDSLAAIHGAGVAERIGHLSTGGGASLEFVEGRALPGVEALRGSA